MTSKYNLIDKHFHKLKQLKRQRKMNRCPFHISIEICDHFDEQINHFIHIIMQFQLCRLRFVHEKSNHGVNLLNQLKTEPPQNF